MATQDVDLRVDDGAGLAVPLRRQDFTAGVATEVTLAAVAVPNLTRRLTLRRAFTAAAVGVPALRRTVRLRRAAAGTAVAALKRTIRKPLGAVAVAVPAFTRSLRLARTFTATAIGRPRAFLRLAADKIPGGGGTTIVRKAITYIFDD